MPPFELDNRFNQLYSCEINPPLNPMMQETLKKADEIFGPDKKDLYTSFEGLLSRHLPT